eukprot:Lithocolla_globosa_v1_NODE_19_length_9697_cov_21.310620.p1 type:complete len:596 gc:universal NODE_19_length_9697_cov_21.310620:6328-8115(+)
MRIESGVFKTNTILPLFGGSGVTIGDSSNKYEQLYTTNITDDGIDLTLTNTILSGTVDLTGDLIPTTSGYDLGSSSKKFSQLHTTNITDNGSNVSLGDIGSNLLPAGAIDIGGTNDRFSNIYGEYLYATTAIYTEKIQPTVGDMNCQGNFVPSSGGSYNLGSAGANWLQLHTDNITDDGSTVLINNLESLIPATDITYNLGSTSYLWNNAYMKDLTLRDDSSMTLKFDHRSQFAGTSSVFGTIAWYSDDTGYEGEVCSIRATNKVSFNPAPSIEFYTRINSESQGDVPILNLELQNDGDLLSRRIYPFIDDIYSLGTLNDRWNEAFFTTARVSDSTTPTFTIHNRDTSISVSDIFGEIDFRSSGNYFGTTASGTSCGRIEMKQRWTNPYIRAEMLFYVVDQGYQGKLNSRNHIPFTDNTYDIGESSLRWDDVYATNGTIQTSDGTKKENILTSELGLDFVNRLHPVSFKWKNYTKKVLENDEIVEKSKTHHRTHYGLISQQVEEVLNDIGVETQDFAGFICEEIEVDDYDKPRKIEPKDLEEGEEWKEWEQKTEINYGLRYQEFISPLIKAIQELSQQNQDLLTRIEGLEEKKSD